MSGYQALFTDLDGILIYSQDCVCDTLLAVFQTVGKVIPSKKEIMSIFGLPVEVVLATLTGISPDGKKTITDFTKEYKRQYPIHIERARFIGGVLETVKYIEGLGCPVYLITSERGKNAAHILGRMGLNRYMRLMITRGDVTCFEPDPGPILKGTAACGTAPRGCVYIGGSPSDTEAGVTAGVFTIATPSGNWPVGSLVEQPPDRVAKGITELCSISDELRRGRTI